MATTTTPAPAKYIGVSIEDFMEGTKAAVDSGKYQDGTSIDPHAREALGALHKSLSAPKLRISNYAFCFSRHCFIIINF
jgi:hypothetical protein